MKKLNFKILSLRILSSVLVLSLLVLAGVPEASAMSKRIRRHLEKAKERHRLEKESGQSSNNSSSNSSYQSDPNIGSYTIRLNCNSCGGSGRKNCFQCGGQRGHWESITVPHYSSKQRVSERVWKSCSACGGSGTKPCSDCGGSGYIYQDNSGRRVR
ncbi:MAG: hypothetical protein II948_07765 [Synergistaceae bacterium]|nr:hypothetical protein [Synergistaceae bacterium]MBQ6739999.1 hypothetical protein [Synergistaceae bacterium]MBR0097458.1 hypothetical protein [Synergistaceae bacterium]